MPLEIYKASAGSGKTFQIVRDYLKIVYKHPWAYKNILAVTFTNKATAEMKDRILKELYNLSSGGISKHLDFLIIEFHLSEDAARRRAGQILKFILHDYSRFSISTIDSLFQRVIRSFAREMHLNPSYRTEIDEMEILEEAVELLFNDIDQNPELKKWMLDYTENNLKDGKKWNLNDELIHRGSELFKEQYKLFSESLLKKLSDKNFLEQYSVKLKELIDQYEKYLLDIGKNGLMLIEQSSLTTDQFKYGKGSFARHFEKLAEGNFEFPSQRVIDAVNCCEAWYKKTDDADTINKIKAIYKELNKLLAASVERMSGEGILANSAKAILSSLFAYGLLSDLALKVHDLSSEKNIVLLNDAASLIYKVINGNNSPFIYEKLGTFYKFFMLDEFQDTSNLQWRNLKPLVENSLAEGNINIIVGDVKQSIYRWRNGDWNLLSHQIQEGFRHFHVNETPLLINWRSSKNVIDFNNIVFKESAVILNEDFESALDAAGSCAGDLKGIINGLYDENFQNFSGKGLPEGYVRIKFIENEAGKKKEDFRNSAVQELIAQIEILQEKGVRSGDIAILVREKTEGAMVARALLDAKNRRPQTDCCYDFISNDTLIIGQSPVVSFILDMFSLLDNPDNDVIKANLVYSYDFILSPRIYKDFNVLGDLHDSFTKGSEASELFRLWLGRGNERFKEEILSLPLYQLAVKIVESFRLEEIRGELVYLEAFLDLILQYIKSESGGIAGFLDWWKLTGNEKTINLPENQNAITIITIHKSKGLEFHTVLIPFCDWEIVPCGVRVPYLWCRTEREPFNDLESILVKYGKHLERTIFSDAYFKEMLYSTIDNLNLLYVAFTRAINSLIVTCPYSSCLNHIKSVGTLLQKIIENNGMVDSIDRERYRDLSLFWCADSKTFEFGALHKLLYKDPEKSGYDPDSSFSIRKEKNISINLHHYSFNELFDNKVSERIRFGNLLHNIFETICTGDDVSKSVRRVVSEGKIDTRTAIIYENNIMEMLSEEPLKTWFSGKWKVYTERNVLRGTEKHHRPDRIMKNNGEILIVDYKTGDKSDKHISQMRRYQKDFKEMGYTLIKGYLWYLNENEIIEVCV